MSLLGVLLILFGVIDFMGMVFGYDLTGVSWSPIVAVGIGSVLINAGGGSGGEGGST